MMAMIIKLLFLLTIIGTTISKKSKEAIHDENNNTILMGSSNSQNQPLYNSQYRIRVRKLDPLSRTVIIKGVEPKFPLDINADGSNLSSPNRYSDLPIKLHVPTIPIKSTRIRRIPIIAQNPRRLPLEFNERLFSFAVHVCHLPSLWYLELVFCMHKGVTKFTKGILTSYTLQDIVGSALASMELPNEGFSLSRCNSAVDLFSDVGINIHSSEICNIMMSCLSTKEFLNVGKKQAIRKWEKEISKIYKEKPPLFRGQQPRSYAQKIITSLLLARRNSEEKKKKKLLSSKKESHFPDKLFYIIRYFNFIMILSEFLISHGFKDSDAFEISSKDYLKIGDESLRQKSPLKMIATCARLIINVHILKNSLDYIPYIRKATWTPFSNVIIQHACTQLISIGFINSEIEIPKNISIDELEYLAYPHSVHLSNFDEKSKQKILDQSDYNTKINEKKGNSISTFNKTLTRVDKMKNVDSLTKNKKEVASTGFVKEVEDSNLKLSESRINRIADNNFTLDAMNSYKDKPSNLGQKNQGDLFSGNIQKKNETKKFDIEKEIKKILLQVDI